MISLTTQADTLLTKTVFTKNQTLTKQKSPYIISGNVIIDSGVYLTVEKGVKLIFDNGNIFIKQGGHINLSGTVDDFINIQVVSPNFNAVFNGYKSDIKLSYVQVENTSQRLIEAWDYSTVSLSNVIQDSSGIVKKYLISVFDNSTLNISNIQISNWKGTVIQVFNNSKTVITDSVFVNNKIAIEIFGSDGQIHTNDFENNIVAIRGPFEVDTHVVDATDNWWGSVSEPTTIEGFVAYTPWSLAKHKKQNTVCCSNVLFLPGMMGSRLYTDGGMLENQLWEPNRNADVKKLFLNSSGQSLSAVYTRDVIDKTNIAGGVPLVDQDIYSGFSIYMNNLVKQDVISAWSPAPYDWRYSPDTILEQGIVQGTRQSHAETSLIDQVKTLAVKSKTKKVTLITHSNGGLVAKQLLIRLRELNLEKLVDKVIFVAMPEFGTPQAITGLLFGHDQSIGGGLILKSATAKTLAKNMPTAYTLLPTTKYFTNSTTPIRFTGNVINSSSDLHQKLSDTAPINHELFAKAEQLHNILDNWSPSPTTQVFQIVGTGLPTVSSLLSLGDSKEKASKNFVPEYSTTGDGVVQISAGRAGQVVSIDLKDSAYKHANIMNSSKVLDKMYGFLKSSNQVFVPTAVLATMFNTPQYKLIKISPALKASTSLSAFLPAKIQIKTSYQEDLNPIPTAKFKYDKYIAGYSTYFDYVSEQSNVNRFELFGDDVHYLHMSDADTVVLSEGDGSSVDVNLIDKSVAGTTNLQYEDIKSIAGADITFGGQNIGGQNISVTIPLVNQSFEISPTKKTFFDNLGNITKEEVYATATESIESKVERFKNKITSSNLTVYVKTRYIRMLDNYLKNKDDTYRKLILSRIDRAITSINTFTNKPFLKGRYSKLKQDYIYLSYLFATL